MESDAPGSERAKSQPLAHQGSPAGSFSLHLARSRPEGCTSDLMEWRSVDICEISRSYSRLTFYSILLVQKNSMSQDYSMLFLEIYFSINYVYPFL